MITCPGCGLKNLVIHECCLRCGEMLPEAEPETVFSMGGGSDLAGIDEHRIKVDLNTPIECMLAIPTALAGLAAVFCLLMGWGNVLPGDREHYMPLFKAILPVALVALLAAWNSSQYYLFDTKKQRVLMATKLAGVFSTATVAPFDTVAFLSVDGHPETIGSRRGEWHYAVTLVLRSGEAVRLSNWSDDFQRCSDTAQVLADFAGLSFRPGKPERSMVVSTRRRLFRSETPDEAKDDAREHTVADDSGLEIEYEGRFKRLLRSPIHVILFLINAVIILYAIYVQLFKHDILQYIF